MSPLFYLSYHYIGGLRDLGLTPHAPIGHGWEEACSYLALVVYVAGCHVALHLRASVRK